MFISVSCFSGFLRIASTNNISIFPPSSAGIGNRFVTPNDSDISAKRYINSFIPFVSATTCDIPTGPIIWSIPTLPVNNCFRLSIIEKANSFVSIPPYIM